MAANDDAMGEAQLLDDFLNGHTDHLMADAAERVQMLLLEALNGAAMQVGEEIRGRPSNLSSAEDLVDPLLDRTLERLSLLRHGQAGDREVRPFKKTRQNISSSSSSSSSSEEEVGEIEVGVAALHVATPRECFKIHYEKNRASVTAACEFIDHEFERTNLPIPFAQKLVGRNFGLRPPSVFHVMEHHRGVLTNVFWRWWESAIEGKSEQDLAELQKSSWEKDIARRVLRCLLPLDRGNALYFMKIDRGATDCPRGIGWFSKQDGEPPAGFQEVWQRQIDFTTETYGTARFPLSSAFPAFCRALGIYDEFQAFFEPCFLPDSHTVEQPAINIECEVLGELPPRYTELSEELNDRGLLKQGQKIERERVLGRGNFGVVYKAKWRGHEVAEKTLPQATVENFQDLEKEARNLKDLGSHRNVLAFKFVHEHNGEFSLVTEFCSLGSLEDVIRGERAWKGRRCQELRQAPNFLLDALAQVACGLAHIHAEGFVHCDLAARNCFVKPGDSENSGVIVVVGDMGLAKNALSLTSAGTQKPALTTAPEVFFDQEDYKESSDIWSFGCLMWELWAKSTQNPLTQAWQTARANFETDAQGLAKYLYPAYERARSPESLKELDCPGIVCSLIPRCLAAERSVRGQLRMEKLHEELEALCGKPGDRAGPRGPGKRNLSDDHYLLGNLSDDHDLLG